MEALAMAEVPILIVGLTVCVYWFCVGAMILRVRRQARGVHRVLIPAQWIERAMWVLWIPVVLSWMTVPMLAASLVGAGNRWIGLPPALASSVLAHLVRMAAALVGVLCLLLSMWCWQHMGRDWRMGIDPNQQSRLLVSGPFAKVRHPIYALSILLMLCTVVILPAPVVLLLAAIHISLMLIKARNEERFLLERHGQAYADYCARTRRFIPSLKRGFKVTADRTDGGEQKSVNTNHRPLPGPAFTSLNSFQQAMLLWEETCPYNAAHALRVSGPADIPALRRVIEDRCRQVGIGRLEVDRETQSYRYLELEEVPLVELPPSATPEDTLAEVISSGVNTPFPDTPCHPLRWSVFNEADGQAHYIVLVYRHIAADAGAVSTLLAPIMRQYLDREDPGTTPPLSVVPPPDACSAAPKAPRAGKLTSLARGLALYFRFRSMHKMPDERDMGNETALAVRTLSEPAFKSLSAACKARGAGLNDACLAALASAIAEQTPTRRKHRHRRKLALGTIASTRRGAPIDLSGHFGVHLSDNVVMLDSPDASLDELLAEICAQTRALKNHANRRPAASALQGFFVRNIWPLLDIPNHRRSYRKLLPICGGVSTFVVDASQFGTAVRAITRYLRVGPPGPAIPIVLSPTVFSDRLELSLIYRLSCLPSDKAEELLNNVCVRLQQISDYSLSRQ
jgi:protein-S-isoprenylcysteine O-methyltransferase Ste14